MHRGRIREYQLYAEACYYRDVLRVWCVLTDEFPVECAALGSMLNTLEIQVDAIVP